MKKMDPDANQLARKHVDEVEQLLRSNSHLHVNELDSILSEINDFLHLRSRELSKGNTVSYKNVFEAINECGSPSEIVKQYLEINTNEIVEPFEEIKGKSPFLFSKEGIGRIFPSRMKKSRKNSKSDGLILPKSLPSNNLRYLTHSYYKKYEYKKKVENWIILSCISIIGVVWIPFLALYWLISFRDVERKFMKSWEENKNFSSNFPYQPGFRTIFTQNKTYQTNLRRINRIKILCMSILIIPLWGYVIAMFTIGVMSLFTIGMAPLLAYYYLEGPKRHINILIEREYQLKSEKSDNYNYLAYYNKAGYLSFDFDITTKIMREINFSKDENISGIFQTRYKMIKSSYIIITNRNVIEYSPAYILGYGDRTNYFPKDQIKSYLFRKKQRKVMMIVETIDDNFLIIKGLDKKVLEPIQKAMTNLEVKYKKSEFGQLSKKRRKKTTSDEEKSFACQVCQSQKSKTVPYLRCENCGRYVCIDCFNQEVQKGRARCPKCEGGLISQEFAL